ncbi:MAG: hypothetical protein A2487_20370 [Candidatus Raymondbacteria bacterium RifOxyC12_full_50_8]|uniref:DUF4423 domain-containing protein n=1 Tax=Candidatus Raymondbacteria bacterium RIFOXYD12_FULL_49_13 TaxID=1817890 RepID=A0A1F7F9Z1_UNCRA|nr:MAG: hypothetical protein A2248_22335 [Candidatus Raymondbacteria bacterium RIFOXYA2_FULL_49_16]OGJ94008.1 MAG: hypothetical protein A2350_19585 [Candidatus Raymondbacteria bacterium RifOxyB12_full_50_8]OGJ96432.1 MAG: hypothetical protein A2487_20370 [Candidatus Raymondbacteria bacterium RifOxyC12_full_50_8]OGK03504.1 MAG: hypothetical protein A2519_09730 [Candidatus Raymondbacteria bacterium RIFOXYD12_FULL_49_13]OGP42823.1 MAG: hypothetical protein A2324_16070 [Candidatus Raymondbacteria b
MKTIYHYSDYRKYLRDYYEDQKKTIPAFSHRMLARRAGFSAPNFILLVIQGKRRLNRDTCYKISKAIGHTKRQSDYFEALVYFQESKTGREKEKYFQRMKELRPAGAAHTLAVSQYDYFSTWYNPIVRELIADIPTNIDYASLAKLVKPAITPGQARKSVELLLQLGLIVEKKGCFVRANPVITTGPDVDSMSVQAFHRAMLEHAIESLDYPKYIRNVTACTLHLSPDGYAKVVEEIAECRKKILSIAEDDAASDRVFQANFQVFPVSCRVVRSKSKANPGNYAEENNHERRKI